LRVAAPRACALQPQRFLATVTINEVKLVRERTGAPLKEVKDALTAAATDLKEGESLEDKAIEILRKKGVMNAAKKAGRTAAQGLVAIRTHNDGRAATVVEVNSETDFVSRNDSFQKLVVAVSRAACDVPIDASSSSSSAGAALPLDGKALQEAKLAGGASIADATVQLVATVRENCQVRRGVRAAATSPAGVVGCYVHGATQAAEGVDAEGVALGRTAGLVVLEANKQGNDAKLREAAQKIAMHVVGFMPQYLQRSDVPEAVLAKEREIIVEKAKKEGKATAHLDKLVEGRLRKYYEEVVLLEQQFRVVDQEAKVAPSVGSYVKTLGTELGDSSIRISSFARVQVGEGIDVKQVSFADEVKAKMQV